MGLRRGQRRLLREEVGQALVLAVLWLALGGLLLLTVPGLAITYAERAAAQSAADAAALACAAQATVTRTFDARGMVYSEVAVVRALAGPAAAATAWGLNVALIPLQTVTFAATPSGSYCRVEVAVHSTLPAFSLLSPARHGLGFVVSALARAYVTAP